MEAFLNAWPEHWGWLWMVIGMAIRLLGRIAFVVLLDD